VESLVGILIVKVPALTVVEPKVYDATALFDCVELYSNTQSKAVARVTVPYDSAADGVEYAVVPELVGATQVKVIPPAE
jgi:hypothetical protein